MPDEETSPEALVSVDRPEYAEDSITRDAVYTVRSVDFVPGPIVIAKSLFDDSADTIKQTWERTMNVSLGIASAGDEVVSERAEKAKEVVRNLGESQPNENS